MGRELDSQVTGELTVVAPVGGGGLLAGLALWARSRRESTSPVSSRAESRASLGRGAPGTS